MNRLSSRKTRYPRRLYHYTAQEGLIGIVRDRKLFATDLRFVNDRTEYQHAIDIATRMVSKHRGPNDQLIFHAINYALADIGSYNTGAVYIASLSAKGDDLNQWRAYSSGGAGFCIGFDPNALQEAVGPSWQLAECIYDDREKDSLVADIMNAVVKERDTREWPLDEQYIADKLGDSFLEMLSDIAPILKDVAFKSEREWRLWAPQGSEELWWRTDKHVPVPYLRISLDASARLAIRSIAIGPSADVHLARLSVKGLLDGALGCGHGVEVIVSNVPYRG